MSVTRLRKAIRRIVPVEGDRQVHDFDMEFSCSGIRVRLSGTKNRRYAEIPWRTVFKHLTDPRKGYQLWSIDQAAAHLDDVR